MIVGFPGVIIALIAKAIKNSYEKKYEHRLVIRKKFSKSPKRDILQIVANIIQQLYPNDYISYDNSVPFLISLTDMGDFISQCNNDMILINSGTTVYT